MKKTILTLAITGAIVTASLTAFAQQDKEAAAARKEVAEAKKELKEAKKDSAADYQKFKKEAEDKISQNKMKIAELKKKQSKDNKETKETYDKKVMSLEQKNNELKKKIDGSATTQTSAWSSFKREFNHDMDELGHAIKDIGVNNKN